MSSQKFAGHKHKKPQIDEDDNEQFHDLPKEQPKKKSKTNSGAAASTFHIPGEAAAPPPAKKTNSNASSSNKPPAGKGGKATVPVMGDDSHVNDEELDDNDYGDEGEDGGTAPVKDVKLMTKTEAKAARVWDRPAVSAASLLPDPKARTPSHITTATSSATTAASNQLCAPLEGSSATSVASTVQPAMRKVIVVLVKASLETVKTKKGYELITADSHKHILQKLNKNPSEYRPDILHQCLLTLLDSPLNKAGLLTVYIQTEKNVLIEVHPTIRMPRTFKRFAGLMVQLLHKLKIRSSDSSDMLLKVIRNPVTDHLPIGSLKIGTSVTGDLVDIRELASNVVGPNPTAPIVFCVGSHASGPAEVNWTDKSIAISKYPLSASVALGRICNAFEGIWNIL